MAKAAAAISASPSHSSRMKVAPDSPARIRWSSTPEASNSRRQRAARCTRSVLGSLLLYSFIGYDSIPQPPRFLIEGFLIEGRCRREISHPVANASSI
jgi:hypothetical protein